MSAYRYHVSYYIQAASPDATVPATSVEGTTTIPVPTVTVGSGDATVTASSVAGSTSISAPTMLLPVPIGAWAFEEGSGTSAWDSSGNNRTITLSDGTNWTSTNQKNGTYALTGASGDTATVSSTGLSPTTGITIMCWARQPIGTEVNPGALITTATGGGSNLFSMFGHLDIGPGARIVGVFRYSTGGTAYFLQSNESLSSTYRHIAMTFDGTTAKLYVDGVLKDTENPETGTINVGSDWYFASSSSGETIIGNIDDARIFDYVLTEAQINAWMNIAVPAGAPPVTQTVRTFDGVNDFITLSTGALSAIDGGPVTVAAIAKRGADNQWQCIFSMNSNTSSYSGWGLLFTDTGKPYISNDAAGPNFTVEPADNWVLIAYTKATGTSTPRYHKYVFDTDTWTHENGNTTQGDGSAGGSNGVVKIGDFDVTAGTNPWTGDIAVVGVFSSVLSDGDIETLVTNLDDWHTLSPAALWAFDQADTAYKVLDLTGNEACETNIGGTTVGSSTIPGFSYNEVPRRRFDGTDDRITTSIGGLASTTTGDMTIAIIHRRSTTGTAHVPIALRTNTSGDDSPIAIYHDAGTSYYLTSTGVFTSGFTYGTEWHLFAVSKASGTTVARFHQYYYYLGTWNHINSGESQANSSSVGGSGIVEIGRRVPDAWNYFSGDMAIMAIFPTALSDAEVETLPFLYSAWHDLNPTALWLFNQTSTSEAVEDQTTGGADQTAITGTSVINNLLPFQIDEIVSGDATVTAVAVTTTTTIPAPILGTDVPASAVLGTTSIPLPTVAVGVTVTPPAVLGTTTVSTIQAGATVNAISVAGTTTIPTSTPSVGQTVAATSVASTTTVPVATIQTGSTITATTASATTSIPLPAIQTTGNATVGAASVACTTSIPAPTVSATQSASITASTVTGTTSIPAVTVTTTADATIVAVTVTGTTTIPLAVPSGSQAVIATAVQPDEAIIPVPDLSAGSTVLASSIETTTTIPVAGAFAGQSAYVTVSSVPAVASVGTVTITAAENITVTVASVAGTTTIPAPVPTAGMLVTPSSVSATTTVSTVSISTGSTVIATSVLAVATITPPQIFLVLPPDVSGGNIVIDSNSSTLTVDSYDGGYVTVGG